MTTAADQIYAAMRLIGALAEGEVPSPQAAVDALGAMNQMIDSWNTERLSVYTTQDQVFTWPASTISRTLGPTGNFVGNRPIALDDATYFIDSSTGVSYGIKILTDQSQYTGIAVKTVTSTYPQVIWVNMSNPNIEMFLYPVPTRELSWHFISVLELSQPATLNTSLAFPPGYLRAFKYNLAVEIANEFGIEAPPTTQRIAVASKRNLKRVNNPGDLMSMPYGLIAKRPRFNIYSGNV